MFAGWVQLWFSIAMTKTVLICCAWAVVWAKLERRAIVPRHLNFDMGFSVLDERRVPQ